MESAVQLRLELSRELAPLRRTLVARQAMRVAAHAVLFAAIGVLVALIFACLLPWILWGHSSGVGGFACGLAGAAGAVWGMIRSCRGWHWPTEEVCALVCKSRSADGSLPTAVGLSMESDFSVPVLRAARLAVSGATALSLSDAVSTRHLIAAPILALIAVVLWVASAGLPVGGSAVSVAPLSEPNRVSRQSAPAAADVAAFEQAMGERRQQDALSKAANDLRDESKADSERQQSLDNARAEAANAGKALPGEIPQAVPASRTEREALAATLEAAAAAAGARAEAIESKGRSSSPTDGGGDAKPGESRHNDLQAAPDYDARRFDDTRAALSDQSAARRELAQAAAEALAKLKQGR